MTPTPGGFGDRPGYGEEPHEPPIIRDKRRLDPETGQRRVPPDGTPGTPGPTGSAFDSGAPAPAAGGSAGSAELEKQLRERTDDLQRLQAEYVNYKRRVDRDREAARTATVGSVLAQLLAVLDDIGRAREHEELTGGFRAVAESLERTVSGLGLEEYGKPGEPFDPYLHEALTHMYSDDVTEPTCVAVMQVGYRMGDRILRPARVAVAEPAHQSASDEQAVPESGEPASPSDDRPEGSTDADQPAGATGEVDDGRPGEKLDEA